MDHSTHPRLTDGELTEENLVGATIYDADDYKVGTISHLHMQGATRNAVVDVGGFLGIGSKPVLINISDLQMMRDEGGAVHGLTTWTKDQLQNLPEHRHGY
jgi:hypothetical protein